MAMVGRRTQATVSRLHGGQRYTLYVVAYNSVGLASGPSAEVTGVASGADDDPVPIPTGRHDSHISRKARRASSPIASHC